MTLSLMIQIFLAKSLSVIIALSIKNAHETNYQSLIYLIVTVHSTVSMKYVIDGRRYLYNDTVENIASQLEHTCIDCDSPSQDNIRI